MATILSQSRTPWRRPALSATALVAVAWGTACGPKAPEDGERDSRLPVALAGGAAPTAGGGTETVIEVTMGESRFTPAVVTVTAGGTVVWRNTSSVVHTVTGDGFDSGNLAPGATWRRTFSAPGTYPYHCVPHRQAGMVGQVVVK